jgi:hypothetical protein
MTDVLTGILQRLNAPTDLAGILRMLTGGGEDNANGNRLGAAATLLQGLVGGGVSPDQLREQVAPAVLDVAAALVPDGAVQSLLRRSDVAQLLVDGTQSFVRLQQAAQETASLPAEQRMARMEGEMTNTIEAARAEGAAAADKLEQGRESALQAAEQEAATAQDAAAKARIFEGAAKEETRVAEREGAEATSQEHVATALETAAAALMGIAFALMSNPLTATAGQALLAAANLLVAAAAAATKRAAMHKRLSETARGRAQQADAKHRSFAVEAGLHVAAAGSLQADAAGRTAPAAAAAPAPVAAPVAHNRNSVVPR